MSYDESRQNRMHAALVFLGEKAKSVNVKDAVKQALDKPFNEQKKQPALASVANLLAWKQVPAL